MNERESAVPSVFVIQVPFVESDVLTGQRRTGQWTRSRVVHINARSHASSSSQSYRVGVVTVLELENC
jgi:hypothetical protein